MPSPGSLQTFSLNHTDPYTILEKQYPIHDRFEISQRSEFLWKGATADAVVVAAVVVRKGKAFAAIVDDARKARFGPSIC
eukprot:CAMPEP_0198112074 /NCGR_PEP_ID=MMETSP1442-20131203/3974_1 /TAXON_ID= /ORGANISM="Craspedostauros australis, Strain CCMP3328" /LENGTH=79 /DNA_ID=CAMNT_0043768731 /DNA_START=207 /DNA_END=446 /DNA_ORIENTATION=+